MNGIVAANNGVRGLIAQFFQQMDHPLLPGSGNLGLVIGQPVAIDIDLRPHERYC